MKLKMNYNMAELQKIIYIFLFLKSVAKVLPILFDEFYLF